MTLDTTNQRAPRRRRFGIAWISIAFFALVLSFADGFVLTTLQGAVGSFERRDPPFTRWLRDSTVMFPLYIAAIAGAVLLARRLVGRNSHGLVRGITVAALIVAASSLLGAAAVANSSAHDYKLQTQGAHSMTTGAPTAASPDGSETTPDALEPVEGAEGCVAKCASDKATRSLHVRAAVRGSLLILLANVILVPWLFALAGDRLWVRQTLATEAHQAATAKPDADQRRATSFAFVGRRGASAS